MEPENGGLPGALSKGVGPLVLAKEPDILGGTPGIDPDIGGKLWMLSKGFVGGGPRKLPGGI